MSDDDDERPRGNGQSHDALFRRTMHDLDDARSVLRAAVSDALASIIDWAGLEPQPARLVDANLENSESDALFRAPLVGTDMFIYLHFAVEHQSAPDPDMPLRFLRTQVRLWDKQLEAREPLSPIIPILVSHGKPWTGPPSMLSRLRLPKKISDIVAPQIPQSEYLLDDLARFDPVMLTQRPLLTAWVRVTYVFLQQARAPGELGAHVGLLEDDFVEIARHPEALALLESLLRYAVGVARTDEETVAAVRSTIRKAIDPEAEEAIMGSVYEKLIEQGRVEGEARGRVEGEARGRVEGEARGRVEGEARGRVEVLLRLLSRKYGPLPDDARARIAAASATDVERFTEQLLFADTLEAALRDPS